MLSEVKAADSALKDADLIRSLRARSAWQWTKASLIEKDLKPGTGYPALESALTANNKYGQDLRVALQAFYQNVRLAGRKYLQIFDLPPELIEEIGPILQGATVEQSNFSSFYPYVLPESALQAAPGELTLCEASPNQDGDFTLVFCSRKDYTERDVFEDSAALELGKLAPVLQGYGKIVGLKTKSFQAFDVAVIRPKLKRLEIMVDMPSGHVQDFDKIDQAQKIINAVSLHIPALQGLLAGTLPTNVFPAIDEIYRSNDGGRLQEIRLRTSTGLVDVLKTTVDSDDLRVNKYHTESAKAVNNEIQVYDITTRLQLSFPTTQVTLRLKSNVHTLAMLAETRALRGFELLDCMSPHDILRSVNKVQSFAS